MTFWREKSKADQISGFIEAHVNSWSMAAAMDGIFSGNSPADGPTIIANDNMDRLIFNATIYGAADSFGQSIGASTNETADGLKEHLSAYNDAEDVYREIIICGTMPEFADVVAWAGNCVYEIRAQGADPTQQYLLLFEKVKKRFGSK